jgi:hypothetical protein
MEIILQKNMLEGIFKPQSFKGRQSVGGIAGMYTKKPYMIPVNPYTTIEESIEVQGKSVTPMAPVEERAKGDLNEEIRQNVPHIPANSIKVENDIKSVSPDSVVKKKTQKRTVPKHLHSTRNNNKTEETNLDDNIFTPKRALI